ncbi:hypothetical protein MJ863_02810 [Alcaligenes ammonioxydans]|uniref:Uncharacterized protein n=1 Tax=Alcaligenes faecalis TaxID=511 RepID=A0A2U2BQ25_ALCFA|nr:MULTISPECIES: hypothetical protein [Alcaligenes]MCH1878517.1 hypothetical protein [Alcaligenes ammonioxydans]PWE16111.1 hypothetical protein DF183_05145 [Alcaligenes faecalis]QBH21176.1 hypothetical protein EYC51_17685 [Alcaligenes faecalis]QBH21252.1 hypothetical protein EYC51_18145 [Alcaligenes faecalis]
MNQQDQQWQQQQDDLRRREQAEQLERERLERLEHERMEQDQQLERERQEKLDQHDYDSRRELEDATPNKPGVLRTVMQILFSRKEPTASVEKQNVEPVFSSVVDPLTETQNNEAVTDFFAEQENQPQAASITPSPLASAALTDAPTLKKKTGYPWKLILALVLFAVLFLSWKYLFNQPVVEQTAALSAAEPSLAEIEDQVAPVEDEEKGSEPSPAPTTSELGNVEKASDMPMGTDPIDTAESTEFQELSIDLGESFPSNLETSQASYAVQETPTFEVQISSLQRDVNEIRQLLNELLQQNEQLIALSTPAPTPEPEPEAVPVVEPAPVKKPVTRRAKAAPKPSVRLVSVDMWDGKPSVVVASTRAGDNQTLVMRPGDTVNGVTLQSASASERSASFLVNGKTTKLTVEGQ